MPSGTVRLSPATARTAPKLLLTRCRRNASPAGPPAAASSGPVRGAAPAGSMSVTVLISVMSPDATGAARRPVGTAIPGLP